MTSSATSPLDSPWPLSYRLPIVPCPLAPLVFEIFDLKVADKHTNKQNSTPTDNKGRLKAERSRTNYHINKLQAIKPVQTAEQEAPLSQGRPRDAAICITFRYVSHFTTASRGFSATARLRLLYSPTSATVQMLKLHTHSVSHVTAVKINVAYTSCQGCGLGLDVSVSRRSRDVPTSRLGLVSTKVPNVSVSSRSRTCASRISSRS